MEKANSKLVTIDRCHVYNGRNGNCKICNQTVMSITKDGEVYLCPYESLKELSIGNIKNMKFLEILSNRMKHPYYEMEQNNFAKPCSECKSFNYCFGGCRINNKYGEIFLGDMQCEKVKKYEIE